MDLQSSSREYAFSINTDDIHDAIRSLASTLYTYVEEALVMHEDHDAEELSSPLEWPIKALRTSCMTPASMRRALKVWRSHGSGGGGSRIF